MVVGLADRYVSTIHASRRVHRISLSHSVLDGTYPPETGSPWLQLKALRGRLLLFAAHVAAVPQGYECAGGTAAETPRAAFISRSGRLEHISDWECAARDNQEW